MKRSNDRILTTHVGSLPRPPGVVEFLMKKEKGETYDTARFAEAGALLRIRKIHAGQGAAVE